MEISNTTILTAAVIAEFVAIAWLWRKARALADTAASLRIDKRGMDRLNDHLNESLSRMRTDRDAQAHTVKELRQAIARLASPSRRFGAIFRGGVPVDNVARTMPDAPARTTGRIRLGASPNPVTSSESTPSAYDTGTDPVMNTLMTVAIMDSIVSSTDRSSDQSTSYTPPSTDSSSSCSSHTSHSSSYDSGSSHSSSYDSGSCSSSSYDSGSSSSFDSGGSSRGTHTDIMGSGLRGHSLPRRPKSGVNQKDDHLL